MSDVKLKVSATATDWLANLFASVDGGISFAFVGHVHRDKSVVLLPGFLKFDQRDRQDILDKVEQEFPTLHRQVVQPVPPGWEPPDDEPAPSGIVIP